MVLYRCDEEREYLKKQQAEVEHKLQAVCKTEADAKSEAKHAQLRYEDREHELNERAALLRRQETELVSLQITSHAALPRKLVTSNDVLQNHMRWVRSAQML